MIAKDAFPAGGPADGSGLIVADVNGDGLDDLLYNTSSGTSASYVYLPATLDQVKRPFDTARPAVSAEHANLVPLDINQDGRMDLAVADHNDPLILPDRGISLQRWKYVASQGATLTPLTLPPSPIFAPGTIQEPSVSPGPLFIGDLNGDGLPETLQPIIGSVFLADAFVPEKANQPRIDYFAFFIRAWTLRPNAGGALKPLQLLSDPGVPSFAVKDSWNNYFADIDGSGRQAFIVRDTDCSSPSTPPHRINGLSRYNAAYMKTDGTTFIVPTTLASATSASLDDAGFPGFHYLMLDVNGDGLMDALQVPNGDYVDAQQPENHGDQHGRGIHPHGDGQQRHESGLDVQPRDRSGHPSGGR